MGDVNTLFFSCAHKCISIYKTSAHIPTLKLPGFIMRLVFGGKNPKILALKKLLSGKLGVVDLVT